MKLIYLWAGLPGVAAALSLSVAAYGQQDRTTSQSSASAAHAARAAGRYSESNFGVAVAVYLGTHPSTPSRERIIEVLTEDFRTAGMNDPVVFFFFQNDIEGSGATIYFGGAARGPMTLAEARTTAPEISRSYNFRKERCLFDFMTECP